MDGLYAKISGSARNRYGILSTVAIEISHATAKL